MSPDLRATGNTGVKQGALLDEFIILHHNLSFVAAFFYLEDLEARQQFIEAVIATLKAGVSPPPNEKLGLPRLEIFAAKDRDEAVKRCFNIRVAESLMWERLRRLNVELFESGGETS